MEREEQRSLCLARRRALDPERRAAYSAAICRELERLPWWGTARRVLSYRATAEEADLSAFHAWAEAAGLELVFPVSGPGGQMEGYAPQGPESWRRGRYGIWEPTPERSRRVAPEELDGVILPCVGFDGLGRRLGHGGGYYDRYLPRCPQAARVLAAFEAQRLERVAEEPWDQRVDAVVTEAGCFFTPRT